MTVDGRLHRLGLVAGVALVTLLMPVPPAGPAAAGDGPRPAGPATDTAVTWHRAAPGYRWSFPRDHRAHPGYRTEWWYLTGQLGPADGGPARYGYQLTLFRIGLSPRQPAAASAWDCRDLVLGHLAITDIAAGRHLFREVLVRAAPLTGGTPSPPDTVLAWCLAPPGTDGRWFVAARGDTFAARARDAAQGLDLDLRLVPAGPVVLHGDGGFSAKTPDGSRGSLYYSLPRLRTTGTLRCGEDSLRVAGESWLDREFFSDPLAPDLTGWDWLCLQLDDGPAVMLYLLRDRDGAAAVRAGTLVGRDGRGRSLAGTEWDLAVTGHWTSPRTAGRYPAGWRLRIPGEGVDLWIQPLVADQENVGERSGIIYWEGAVTARDAAGDERGRGYVELTGYVPGGRGLP